VARQGFKSLWTWWVAVSAPQPACPEGRSKVPATLLRAPTSGKAWLAHQHLMPQGDENLAWTSSRDAFLTLQIDQLQRISNDRNNTELQGRAGMIQHTARLVTRQRLTGAV